MADTDAQRLRLRARLVIGFAIMLVIVGTVWHGISIGTFQRIWHDLIERPDGPLDSRGAAYNLPRPSRRLCRDGLSSP